MKERMIVPINGLVNSNQSFLQTDIDTVYIGKKRYLNILASIELKPDIGKASTSTLETFELKISLDDNILKRENVEVDLLEGKNYQLETDVELHNTQFETRFLKVEMCNFKNNIIEYTAIKEMINIEPIKESKTFVRLDYYQDRDLVHNFSYYTNKSTNRVFMKMNNHNWREITEGFKINNDDLEGKINYIQLYTTDEENHKIYSNVVRVTKT